MLQAWQSVELPLLQLRPFRLQQTPSAHTPFWHWLLPVHAFPRPRFNVQVAAKQNLSDVHCESSVQPPEQTFPLQVVVPQVTSFSGGQSASEPVQLAPTTACAGLPGVHFASRQL